VRERVVFEVEGQRVVGDLYRPAGPGPHPAVVVAGPMTSVKEQASGVYAAALAVRGIAGFAIDHRHFGESSGEPRQWEHPEHKIADLAAALDCVAHHDAIDGRRVGLVGVCLGAAYGSVAAHRSGQVSAFAAVAGYFPQPDIMRAGDPDSFDAEVRSGRDALTVWERTGEAPVVPAAGNGGAPMTGTDIVEYYTSRRGAVPNYRNEFAVQSRSTWLTFDPHRSAAGIDIPTLFIHSNAALAPNWAKTFSERIASKSRFEWFDDVKQTDFYDQPIIVDRAADLVAEHLFTTWQTHQLGQS
jgi:uncharacterized protein